MRRNPACFYAVVVMFMGVMSGADPEGDCLSSSLCTRARFIRFTFTHQRAYFAINCSLQPSSPLQCLLSNRLTKSRLQAPRSSMALITQRSSYIFHCSSASAGIHMVHPPLPSVFSGMRQAHAEREVKYIGLCHMAAWLQGSCTNFISSGLFKERKQIITTCGETYSRPAQALILTS